MLYNTNNAEIVNPSKGKSSSKGHLGNFRTPGLLAKWPLIGLLMVLLGVIAFGALAVNLQTNGPLIKMDASVVKDIHAVALRSSPFIRDVIISGFYLGGYVVLAIGVLLGLYFLYKRFWPELCMVVIAWAGQGLIFHFLSQYFGRHRPVFDVPIWHLMTGPGFPSGHCISAVMCYGLLAYLLVPKIRLRFWKAVTIVLAILVILFIGFSRIFVGDHYLTDTLAGYALGIALSGFVYTLIELIIKKRKDRGYVQEKEDRLC